MKYLIVGLGNIGAEYANTRHNIGFVVCDALARDLGATFSVERYASKTEARFKGRTLVMIKPTTYMNLSGKAVKYWLDKENIPLENLLVVVDDIALSPGTLRMKRQGSAAGHNGLTDIILKLNTNEFSRLRVGIGDDFRRGFQVDYVLGQWTRDEEKLMIPRVEVAVEMIKSYTAIGIDLTMTAFNNK
ncbi:MAG: aminoacyl-tRNA hydrolase [Bacteroidales bacterium]|nr:aminoacyl-tRNA hydrolase [Bacteroidales bacterium]